MQKSLGFNRLLAYGLLGLTITTALASYTPSSEESDDGTQLEKKDDILSQLLPSSLTGLLFGSTADITQKLEIVESMLDKVGLPGVLNETAVTDILSHGTGLPGTLLNKTIPIPSSLLNQTGLPQLEGVLPRDVWSPKIIEPNGQTVWVSGTTVKVKWNTHNAPKQITNKKGMIVLGYIEDGTEEHLNLEHPLADDFDITQGHIDVTVPYVDPRNDYIIVLFGDSGNKSPLFTIN